MAEAELEVPSTSSNDVVQPSVARTRRQLICGLEYCLHVVPRIIQKFAYHLQVCFLTTFVYVFAYMYSLFITDGSSHIKSNQIDHLYNMYVNMKVRTYSSHIQYVPEYIEKISD
jgi:hypothetical protein